MRQLEAEKQRLEAELAVAKQQAGIVDQLKTDGALRDALAG